MTHLPRNLIDRRREPALQMLSRLAFAEMRRSATTAQSQTILEGCPPLDAEPIVIDGYRLVLGWRLARIAAAEQASVPPTLGDKLAAKGIVFLQADAAALGGKAS